ncbi:MAG: lipocalin family protein [Siphonobacter sp.]
MTSLFSCSTIPEGATTVKPFDKKKYLGKWFEIARLDFKYEKDLNNTTAEYTLNENGTIRVDNKGYNYKKEEWKQSIGKAKFVGKEDIAKLINWSKIYDLLSFLKRITGKGLYFTHRA